ncbi:helix-turn-helix transcriptional regulator [Corynebacterium auriscanis]|uniref:helix-turn-helix transcriptional regulator n=1 Tax=Corynebacterium auriscanis TaxID=99807 RepID=UPI003CE9C55F
MTDFVRQRQAAEELGVSVRTLRRWSASGYFLEPLWLGGRVVYERRAFDSWVERVRRKEHSPRLSR